MYDKIINDKINYYINVHYELYGKNFKWHSCFKDISKEIEIEDKYTFYLYIEDMIKKYLQYKKEYGVFLGRCQPFSNAHNETIQEIIRDGLIPVIILGSINKNDDRNPLTFEERKRLIKMIYPRDVIILGLEDKTNWEEWMDDVIKLFDKNKMNKKNITLYSHIKDIDNTDFNYKGIEYKDSSYTKMFEINDIKIKDIDEKTCFLGNVIHASDIRKDEETAIRNLDARIYRELKDKYDWW